jgi:Uma2 family endonuclease
LSDSSEAYDRGKKFNNYRLIASLREYLLVSEDSPTIERYSRNRDGTWTLTVASGLDQSLQLTSIGVKIPLATVFATLEFTPPA